MKTNTIPCCPVLTKNFTKKVISNSKGFLLLFFFLGIFSTGASAQNSCLITGNAVANPYPTAVISSDINGEPLQYRVTPSVASTYLWFITNNTSGATATGITNQVVTIDPGGSVGSFTLTCRVSEIGDSTSVNTCTVSVAVIAR